MGAKKMNESQRLVTALRSADAVLAKGMRVNGNDMSAVTRERSKDVIYAGLRVLHAKNYYVENVANLTDKHVEILVRDWWDRKLKPKTIENYYGRLKSFFQWMGRENVLRKGGRYDYLPDVPREALKVTAVAVKSKSWTENGVHVEHMLETAKMEDKRWYCMLLLELYFGLRCKEVLNIDVRHADCGDHLRIDKNIAKNGRPRIIVIKNDKMGEHQRRVLDYVKGQVGRGGYVRWPGKSFTQARDFYFNLMKKHGLTKAESGVTGHGLRAEYAENQALLAGLLPPTLGGTRNQLPKAQMQAIALKVSNNLGHNDLHVTGAYYGSFRKAPAQAWTRTGGFPLDETRLASVCTDPPLIQEPDGSYKQKNAEERAWIAVCVRIEEGGEVEKEVDLETFAKEWPHKTEQLHGLLRNRGLGEEAGQ